MMNCFSYVVINLMLLGAIGKKPYPSLAPGRDPAFIGVFDSTAIHAEAAVTYALGGDGEQ